MISPGLRGATAQSFSEHNPRDLLMRLRDDDPSAQRETLFARFNDAVQEPANADYLAAVIEYWFANNFLALTRAQQATDKAARLRLIAAGGKALDQMIEHRAAVILMDMVTPNGKALGDCARRDLERTGGFFGRVAAAMPNRKLHVRNALTEDQLHALWAEGIA